ncbi:hypothetical protein PYCCODRAFT_448186 [Trametes coccinea BRFM310]|uniref:Uncharacterized protein n=1 Tax=Trametes coccinea (strain BRFM310) TaxID=1353009 RepID=A0A1Y2IM12_TRAC3|nr:hypothetical protein PYCCODRAFT_448186 [Trametes coccinea BRFM310]
MYPYHPLPSSSPFQVTHRIVATSPLRWSWEVWTAWDIWVRCLHRTVVCMYLDSVDIYGLPLVLLRLIARSVLIGSFQASSGQSGHTALGIGRFLGHSTTITSRVRHNNHSTTLSSFHVPLAPRSVSLSLQSLFS